MILIAHRGNTNGESKYENNPDYLLHAMQKYNVETDVWYVGYKFYLGHDEPQYLVDIDFLKKEKIWCHAKNLQALEEMLKYNIHCFWCEFNVPSFTSRGYIWAYPSKQLTDKTICVMPEVIPMNKRYNWDNCAGVCSDFIGEYYLLY